MTVRSGGVELGGNDQDNFNSKHAAQILRNLYLFFTRTI